ncbi:hypothetical protein K469DRAFT_685541 [Zopfia rhizophila CBS 207.26]|uniref:DUF6594 domain-containing protein n=1 Tax=Zopfia rhizophila CBS 207.26 TaxID=1314779 RepID=A0A6A6EBY9_9PEZI|nr:hypothetical protein K469DRAFT_685541 [Zopfia rhizophila CBS 207.26]
MATNQLATLASQIPLAGFRLSGSTGDLLKALQEHEDLFNSIAAHPQAGIYQRFGKERALRLSYVENEVRQRHDEVKELLRDVHEGRKEAETEETRADLAKRMGALIEILDLHSRAFEQDCRMSQSTTPSPLFMDFYRAHLQRGGDDARAPNGELISFYDSKGAPISHEFTALDNPDLDPMQSFLVNRLMNPFLDYVRAPVQKLLKKIARGQKGADEAARWQGTSGRIISAIAKAVTCMLATLSLAAAIGILYSINSLEGRLVVMTLFGLGFSSSVNFLGQDAIPIYALNAA